MTKRQLHEEYETARLEHDAANERRRKAESELWWAEDEVKRTWGRVQLAYVALAQGGGDGEDAAGGKE